MKKKIIWIAIMLLAFALIFATVLYIKEYREMRNDFVRFEEESFDTVFISMYPTDNYMEEDYMYYRGMQTIKCDYVIPNATVIKKYLEKINQSSNNVTTIYLGIDPEKVDKEDIEKLILDNPHIMFEIVLSHPQMSYWLDMNEKECEKVILLYEELASYLCDIANARIYFFGGAEWLVCNSLNYESYNLTNKEVSLFLMCNSDYLHPYMLQSDKIESSMNNMRELVLRYRNTPVCYPDATEYDVVFLGDSIIGNYTNSMSIPEVVSALSGASVFNCGVNGASATLSVFDVMSATEIVEALKTGDISAIPSEHQAYEGIYNFIHREEKDSLMFVINFGLNDYFCGYPIYSEEYYDMNCFSGAMRTIVNMIQESFPDATIILCTPNYTIAYDYGKGIQSECGGQLEDYVQATLAVAEEMNVEILDNYNELPITEENWSELLVDGCHFNEHGNFLVGSRIALSLPK